uniref:ubiquitinyl hydrolase 1 n=1 Tax=Biomphalaria glabrata TaxID=6526 RepID=A0A2C9M7I9_BIOGL
MRGNLNIISGNCPNCQKKMFFPEHEASVECTGCGQRHAQSNLQNLQVTGMLEAIQNLLEKLRQRDAGQMPIPDQDSSKVNGLSNYLCAMLSPLLTTHGMDKVTGTAKLLTEMGKSSIFDCSQLADRAFLLDPEHMNVPGYGRDKSGSVEYLKQTLGIIKKCNENEERLVPIHADGDGHCLVHAVSRALVGWQLFWHPLRMNLIHHFRTNFPKYQMQFQDFIDESEWQLIIRECEPDFIPIGAEPTGLRNIHIFGLANVLKRPIILLDSLEGIQSPGDYSAIFLPCFSSPSECMNKDGVLNTPICIAWSSPGRNHFIPLVGVKGKKCPVLPKFMVQRAWGVADTEIQNYVKMDEQGCCQIGGEKVLQPAYFQRLVAAMSELFDKTNRISAALLADMYHHVFKAHGFVFGMNIELLMDKTKLSVEERLLFMCTMCHSLCLANDISEDRLYPGGDLYARAVSLDGKLREKVPYKLHVCKALYDATQDRLVVIKGTHKPSGCPHCAKPEAEFRLVDANYKVHYKNGDRTTTRSNKCSCGFKHFYNGHEYDGTSKRVKVDLEWGGRSFIRVLDWFQDQEDVNLNSNAYELAQNLVQELFPGEFGSERLVQRVVDQILQQTQIPEMDTNSIVPKSSGRTSASQHAMNDHQASWSADTVSKVILTGHQSVHKEELTKSEAEKKVRQQISANAPKQQRKLSDQMTAERRHSPESGNQKTQVNQSSVSNTSSGNTAAGFSNPLATNKRIRLSTSDGRNVTLDLPSECTFTELQSLISSSLGVTPTNQRIRHGFPPRELKPPPGSGSDFKVPIQPGDKIMLDIIDQLEPKAKSAKVSTDVRKIIHPLTPSKGLSWTSFAEGEFDEASDRVLQGLMDPLLTSGGDNLDHSLSALALTAALDNKELWPYVIQRPHLFSVNGLFYKQVERDMGLEHGKHCQLPLLPHKVHVYLKVH